MQDEKELEEIRLRVEILEREEQEQKKAKMQQEEEKRKNEDWKRRMMTMTVRIRWEPWCWKIVGKWKFTLTLVISIVGTTILHDLLLSQKRRRKLPRRRRRPEQCRLRRPFRISVRLQNYQVKPGTHLTKKGATSRELPWWTSRTMSGGAISTIGRKSPGSHWWGFVW